MTRELTHSNDSHNAVRAGRRTVVRASCLTEQSALVVTVRGRNQRATSVEVPVANRAAGKSWILYRDGDKVAASNQTSAGAVAVTQSGPGLSIRADSGPQTDFVLFA